MEDTMTDDHLDDDKQPPKHRSWLERFISLLAREPQDPDSAETSFSIMLGDWPDGDGRYTVVGRVASGMEVLEELVKVPQDADGRPLVRLAVSKAEVVGRAELGRLKLAPPKPIDLPPGLSADAVRTAGLAAVVGGILLMMATGLAAFLCVGRRPQAAAALSLLNVLIGCFLLMVVATPMSHRHPIIGVGVFLALLGTIRRMARFES